MTEIAGSIVNPPGPVVAERIGDADLVDFCFIKSLDGDLCRKVISFPDILPGIGLRIVKENRTVVPNCVCDVYEFCEQNGPGRFVVYFYLLPAGVHRIKSATNDDTLECAIRLALT